jgi:hypothetical protein
MARSLSPELDDAISYVTSCGEVRACDNERPDPIALTFDDERPDPIALRGCIFTVRGITIRS